MADHTNSKDALGSAWPSGAIDSSWSRLEPLVNARKLRDNHLFGIPLVSALKDPITKKPQVMGDELIDEIIRDAVGLCEIESGLQIFPTEHREKYPFDKNEFTQLGYFQIRNRPVSSIQALKVVPSNNIDVYVVPNDWIETAYLHRGQINIIPLNIATVGGGFVPAAQAGGAAFFLSILGQRPWIAAFWQIDYTTGWPDGKLPRPVNEYIATVAAIEVLGRLAATYARATSHSVGIDALSQSISGPGPQIFVQRITELTEKRKMLLGKLKSVFGLKILSNNV